MSLHTDCSMHHWLILLDHNHAYIPTTGFPDTNASALRLLLGPDSAAISEDRAFCVQSIGGTGPIRIGAEVLRRHLGLTGAVYSNPTWMNHKDIFDMTGFDRVEPYSYWSDKKQGTNCTGWAISPSK
jgi:aspartate/tyrosine/aromatic aminotransferase